MRRHFVENARYWVREFHVDGLRLDAIHSIFDQSPVHILTELAEAAREEARLLERPVHIIAESHDNDRRIVLPASEGGIGLDAVWADDFHHAIHSRLTGERGGYYVDFADGKGLARAMAEGFAYQGEPSEYFGRPRGTPSADLGGERFVLCLQNHDQVGNRAQGDRLSTIVPMAAVKMAAALLFAAPALPLLFMGEEYGETSPFQFFTSYPRSGAGRGRARRPRRRVQPLRLGDRAPGSRRARHVPSLAAESLAGRRPAPPRAARVLSALAHPASHAPRARRPRQGARAVRARRQWQRAHADPRGARRRRASAWSPTSPTPRGPSRRPRSDWRDLLDSEDPRFAGGGMGRPLAPYQAVLYEVSRRV